MRVFFFLVSFSSGSIVFDRHLAHPLSHHLSISLSLVLTMRPSSSSASSTRRMAPSERQWRCKEEEDGEQRGFFPSSLCPASPASPRAKRAASSLFSADSLH